MAKAISYKISLLGSDTVVSQFEAVGKAGAKAFAQIQAAAAAAASAAGLTSTANAAQSAAAGMTAAGRSAEKAAEGFSIGRREIVGLNKALREVGLGGLSGGLVPLAAVGSRLGPVALALTAIGAAVTGVGALFSKFSSGAEEASSALEQLAKAGNTSFESLSSLQIVFAQGGTSLKTFAQEFGKLQDSIAAANDGGKALADSMNRSKQAILSVADAQLALKEAQLKAKSSTGQLTESQEKSFDKQKRRLVLEQAEVRLQQAKEQAAEADANNLDTLVNKFQQISRGAQRTFDPLTTLESKVKAISTVLADLSADDQVANLADIFKNLSLPDQAKIGKALGLSPETIATYSRGGAAIRAMQAEVVRLGVALTALDNQNLDKLKSSQSEVSGLWDALKNKMGALASPAFSSFWEGLGQRIKELVPEFLKLGASFGRIDFSALGRAAGDLALSLANIAVELAKALEAAAKGDFSGITKVFDALGASLVQQMGKWGTSAGQAFLTAIKEALIPDPDTNLWDAFEKDFIKFRDSVIANLKILGDKIKRGLQGGIVSPAGAAEVGGGPQLGGSDFGPMIAGAEVAAVRIRAIFADAFKQSITLDFSAIMTAAQQAATDLQLLFSTAAQQITQSFSEQQYFSGITNAAQTFATDLQLLFSTAAQQIVQTFSSIDISSALSTQIDLLINKFRELATAAAAAARAASGGGGGGGGEPAPFARGGLFGGRGTGTSDSNLAWLSRGEYITPAHAVRQPGVLAFLEALRRSGGNLRDVLDGMGRFALGGMVPRAIPAFATGGLAGGMSNVTIQFPGLPAISGLRASSDVVDQLHKAAALAQVRSGGRKPSRYS